jgi:hypothetical protein
MKRSVCLTAWCLAAAIALPLAAQDKTAAQQKKADEKVLDTYIAKEKETRCCFGACAINYRKELGVPLEFLDTLGARIHQARKLPDPVELALLSQGLAVAEKVAGKKAAITSDDILKDAMQLVRMRDISQELAAMAQLAPDQKARQELSDLADVAREREEAAKLSKDKTKEIVGTLQVNNHTSECLRIYVDGRCYGTVHTGEVAHFYVHSHRTPNHLEAYCLEGGELVRCAHYFGSSSFVRWCIH